LLGGAALVALCATGCSGDDETASDSAAASVETPGDFGEVAARVDAPSGLIELCLLLAETAEQRSLGLMDAPDADLWGFDGMAFRFDEESLHGFWMKDTEVPLSIAWISSGGAVVDSADMDPCPASTSACPITTPTAPSVTAIEVPQGELAAAGLVAGATVELGGACKG
jgi:uncharacterized membrane protein (UPF0127 family)